MDFPFCDPVQKFRTEQTAQKPPEGKGEYMVTAESELFCPEFCHYPGCDHAKCDHCTISVDRQRSDRQEFIFHKSIAPFSIVPEVSGSPDRSDDHPHRHPDHILRKHPFPECPVFPKGSLQTRTILPVSSLPGSRSLRPPPDRVHPYQPERYVGSSAVSSSKNETFSSSVISPSFSLDKKRTFSRRTGSVWSKAS